MTDLSPERVAEIAEGLTKAQRQAILRCEVYPTSSTWVREQLGLDGDFRCYVGDGVVRSTDFDGVDQLFQVVGANNPRGAATLFGNIYPPGLAVRDHLLKSGGSNG